jgi:hypothetical protein
VIFAEPQFKGRRAHACQRRRSGPKQPVRANAGGNVVGHDAPGNARLILDKDRPVLSKTGPDTTRATIPLPDDAPSRHAGRAAGKAGKHTV